MRIADLLGAPVADNADYSIPDGPACRESPSPPLELAPEARRRTTPGLVVAFLLAAGVVLGVGLVIWSGRGTASADTATSPPPGPEIGEVAELFVAVHLGGTVTETGLTMVLPGYRPSGGPTGLWVNRSAAVASRSLGKEFWLITVAADMLEMVDGAFEPAGIQHYQVTVAATESGPVVISPPARVPSPTVVVPSGIPTFDGPVPPDQAATVEAFLHAYLTASGDAPRYLAPTARIPVFATPPYQALISLDMETDSRGRVRAQVEVATSNGARSSLEYVVELTFDNGVWEVSQLLPAVAT